MILIFKKINSATIVSDIEEFIAPVLAGGLFKRSGKIENIKIQMLEVTGSNHVEYNALVNVEPDTGAGRQSVRINPGHHGTLRRQFQELGFGRFQRRVPLIGPVLQTQGKTGARPQFIDGGRQQVHDHAFRGIRHGLTC